MEPCPFGPAKIAALRNRPESLSAAESRRLWEHLERCDACFALFEADDTPVEDTGPLLGERLRHLARPADTPPATAAEAPPVIPGFDRLQLCARGGHAVVYRAYVAGTDRPVALKVLRFGLLASPAARARFLREWETTRALDHPNLLRAFAHGEAAGCFWAALEYLPRNLAQRWRGEPQPAAAVAALVDTLARAVEYAHQRGVIHRDLKPANVLLTDQDEPRVTDFGFALLREAADAPEPLTRTGEVLGTPPYMAPEQARGKRKARVDARADVYALGAILYEGLTGRPPFVGDSPAEVLVQVLGEEPIAPRRLRPGVPAGLELICLKCLRKEPARRYATAADLADELRRFRTGEPLHTRPESRVERGWRWCRRHKVLSGVLAALAVAAPLLAGLFAWGWREADHRAAAERELRLEAERRQQTEARARRQELRRRAEALETAGAWAAARAAYHNLLGETDDAAERLRLRLKLVRAAAFLDDLAWVKGELKRLEQEPLGPLAGVWRLEMAAYLLEQNMQQIVRAPDRVTEAPTPEETAAVALLRQVADDDAVPEADRLTAQGLLADSAVKARGCLEQALAREPVHPYAVPYAVSVDTLAGRLEAALAGVEVWRRMNPRDPNPLLHRCFLLTLMQRYAESEQTLVELRQDRYRAAVPRDTFASYQAVLRIVRQINDYLGEGMPTDLNSRVAFTSALTSHAWGAGGFGQTGVFRVPLTPAQRQDYARFLAAVRVGLVLQMPAVAVLWPGNMLSVEEALARLDRTDGFTPAGLRRFFRASLLAQQLLAAVRRGDSKRAGELGAQGVQELEHVLTEPSLFDLRRVAHLAMASYRSSAGAIGDREQLRQQARAHLRQAVGLGPMRRGFALQLRELAQRSGDEVLVRDVDRYLQGGNNPGATSAAK